MSERKTRGSGREIKLTEGLEHNLVPKGKGLGTTLLGTGFASQAVIAINVFAKHQLRKQ